VLIASGLALAAVILGGASQENALPQMWVQLLGIVALFAGLTRLGSSNALARHSLSLILLGAVIAFPLLQLIPLPIEIWKNLPGHSIYAPVVDSVSGPGHWLPFSLTPDLGLRSFLFLLAPAGMFVLTLSQTEDRQKLTLAGFAVGAGVCAMLGVLQVASGGDASLYAYPTTNLGFAVGTFANKNHTASFLLVFMIMGTSALLFRQKESQSLSSGMSVAMISLLVVMTMVMIAVIRSRAGFLLFGLAFVAVALMMFRRPELLRRTLGKWSWALPLGAVLIAAGLAAATPVLSRFAGSEPRLGFWPVVFEQAKAALPLGTGLGSFQPVYAAAEPLDTMVEAYINHAHNDYLELLLEAGLPGVILLGLGIAWFGVNARRIWASNVSTSSSSPLGQAASLGIGLILLHSLVDYPLRTEAMSVFLAYMMAIVCTPSEAAKSGR
jgi:O-antigen ligase